jgi:hypothetical protein
MHRLATPDSNFVRANRDSKRWLVLSVDYEIFGNGSGDVRQHIVEPADRMARLCRRYAMPLTVFFEVEEYLAFERFDEPLKQTLGYSPSRLIREQIISLAEKGHDIQLHLHPEWYDARFDNRHWQLRMDKQTVDSLFESQGETDRYVAQRKEVVDALIGRVAPGRKVTTYRAGAFRAQPGTKLLRALEANGILIDSSVVKGLQCGNGHLDLDYRNAPSAKGPWRIKDDVARENPKGGIWEFPIYSVMRRRLHQATPRRLRAKFSRNVPKDRQRDMINQLGVRGVNPLKSLRFLWQKVPIKLDFHNVSPGKLLDWIRSAPKPEGGKPDLLVLIGHTKEHTDDKAFETLLKRIAADPGLEVVTFDNVAKALS